MRLTSARTWLLLGVSVLGLGAGCIRVRPLTAFQKATSMEQYERAMWDAIKEGKWNEVQGHMAASYLANTPEGLMDRAAALAHFQQMKIAEYTIADLQSVPNGADMTVTYTLRLRGTAGGQALSGRPMRVLTVWQTVQRGWVQIAQAVTRIED